MSLNDADSLDARLYDKLDRIADSTSKLTTDVAVMATDVKHLTTKIEDNAKVTQYQINEIKVQQELTVTTMKAESQRRYEELQSRDSSLDSRVRVLEQFRWQLAGACLAVSVIAGYAFKYFWK